METRRLILRAIGLTAGLALSLAWSALAQMQTGERMKDYHTELGLGDVATFEAILLGANAPANIFWPDHRRDALERTLGGLEHQWLAGGHAALPGHLPHHG